MSTEHFHNPIIGSGVAGKLLGWTLAKQGRKTVVVERSMLGGSCPNIACLPSKNVIHSAKAAHLAHPTHGLGIVLGMTGIDMAAVVRRKRQMVDGLMDLHRANFAKTGAELCWGEGRFIGERRISVTLNAGGTRELAGDRVFLCLGSRATIPNAPGLAAAKPMTH